LLSRGEEPHTKKSAWCLMFKNHSIIAIIFSPIDFKKRLSRRDIDERFHLLTTQEKVKKNLPKLHEVSRDRKV
jgi:hypothetical protein